jgi:serine/threonine protein kinase
MLGLLRDLETMAAIRHPNLLAVHGVGIQEGRPGMWADLIQGRTAEAMLASGGPLAPDRIASIGADLCRAMDALHFAGIVHGSVGTSKLAYESDGRAILMDATPPVPLEVTIRQFLAGRPVFLAPEILQGSVPGIASDVYSAGAVLYRLATGRNVIEPAPHEDLRSCIERWQVVPVAEARPGFPAGLADAIHSAIARHPSDRLTSARSLLVALPALSPA